MAVAVHFVGQFIKDKLMIVDFTFLFALSFFTSALFLQLLSLNEAKS